VANNSKNNHNKSISINKEKVDIKMPEVSREFQQMASASRNGN